MHPLGRSMTAATLLRERIVAGELEVLQRLTTDAARPYTVVLGGFSGHGFKMATGLGEIGARLAVGEDPGFDLDFLSAASPAFAITNVATGEATHNAVVASHD